MKQDGVKELNRNLPLNTATWKMNCRRKKTKNILSTVSSQYYVLPSSVVLHCLGYRLS